MSDDEFEENMGGGYGGGEEVVDEGDEEGDGEAGEEKDEWDDDVAKDDESEGGDIGGRDNEPDISDKADFKHLQQLSSEDICDRVSSTTQKYLRSPLDAALAQACGILSSKHDKMSKENKIKIIDRIRVLKNLPLLNIECLIAAEVWKQSKRKLKPSVLEEYAKEQDVKKTDLLRYIRMSE